MELAPLDIQIAHVQRVVFNELAARLDLLTHQFGKHFLRLNSIGQINAQQLAVRRVHGRLKQFLGVHFTQAFKSFNGQTASPDFLDADQDFGDREKGFDLLFVAFTLNHLEQGFVLSRVVLYIEALPRQFIQQFLNDVALVEFLVPCAAGRAVLCLLNQRRVALFLAREPQVEVRVLCAEPGQILTVEEIMNAFLVALADSDQVLRQFVRRGMAMLEINGEIAAFAPQPVGVFVQRLEQLQDLAQLLFRELLSVLQVAQAHFLGTELNEDSIQLRVIIHVLDPFLTGDLIQRRLGDIHEAALYQFRHLPVEESQEQGANVRTIHVGIGHDNNLVITQFAKIESAFAVAIANACAHGRNHGADFVVLKDLVQPRFLDVYELAANRQNGLKLSVAALLGRAAGGITFDDVQLRIRRVAVGAIGQFARQAPAGQRRFAHRFTRLARRFAGAGRIQALVHHFLGHRRVGVEVRHQPVVSNGTNDALNLRRKESLFGLVIELGVRVLDGDDRHQTLKQIVSGHRRVFLLEQVVLLGVLVDRPRQGSPKPSLVSAAIRVVDSVGVSKHLRAVAVVVLDDDIHRDVRLAANAVLRVLVWPPPAQDNRLGVQGLLAFAKLLDEFLDAVLVIVRLSFGVG